MVRAILLVFVLLVLASSGSPNSLPHVDECNFCYDCVPDEEPPTPVELPKPTAQDLAAWVVGREKPTKPGPAEMERRAWEHRQQYAAMLQPDVGDAEAKALLPNCTRCRGCTTKLIRIRESSIKFMGVQYAHGAGATNGRIFFSTGGDGRRKHIVKVVTCMAAKPHGHAALDPCLMPY